MPQKNENNITDGREKTEAEYSAQIIKLLLSVIKWLIVAIVVIILMFLGMVVYVLNIPHLEIELGHSANQAIITTMHVDSTQNKTTFDM